MKIISGTSNRPLAEEIAKSINQRPMAALVGRFSDGEVKVELRESVRGSDVFVIQSTCPPVNDNLQEMLVIIDALKRGSAKRITAVMPYFGYARQDRKVLGGTAISAKLVADQIVVAGASRVLLLDIHSGQTQGFFSIPSDNFYASYVFIPYLKANYDGSNLVILSPDAGGTERARAFAKRLGAEWRVGDKRRLPSGELDSNNYDIIGSVEGKRVVLLDDMVDTAGTLCLAANAAFKGGATSVDAMATHAVLSGSAVERLKESGIGNVIVSDSIPLSDFARAIGKFTVLSVANLLGKAMECIHYDKSTKGLVL